MERNNNTTKERAGKYMKDEERQACSQGDKTDRALDEQLFPRHSRRAIRKNGGSYPRARTGKRLIPVL